MIVIIIIIMVSIPVPILFFPVRLILLVNQNPPVNQINAIKSFNQKTSASILENWVVEIREPNPSKMSPLDATEGLQSALSRW
jgi:hypothetical protein